MKYFLAAFIALAAGIALGIIVAAIFIPVSDEPNEPYEVVCIEGFSFAMSNKTNNLTEIYTGNSVLHCSM